VYQEFQVAYMNNNEWKLPLNLAIGLHVLLVLTAIYMPGLFHSRPIHPDVYTVNLVNVAELGQKVSKPSPKMAPTNRKAETAKPEIKLKPVEIKKSEPIVKKEPLPAVPVEKAVSLKPLKRKIERDKAYDALINERIRKLKIQERRERALEEKKKLEQIHRQRLAESIKAEQTAEQEARLAADELKHLLQSSAPAKNSSADTGNQGNQTNENHGSSNNFSAIENQYFAAISNRIQQFWALPELKSWDPSLTAIVWITINKDGTIVSQHFESSSGDKFFDQYVEKALRDAVPLPQIPVALNKSHIEVGLRFKPSGIQ
jgi:TonB family protein